jgi:predicted  nucleic acid-binding Zn-ribbon protein
MSDQGVETCKNCNRIVLAGPPCCYWKAQDLLLNAQKEISWLRKIQSAKDKKIAELQKDLTATQDALLKELQKDLSAAIDELRRNT